MKNAFSYVKWHSDRGIGNYKHMDYAWLRDSYLPALKQGGKASASRKQKDIISDGYYLLGDIYDFIDAPKLAAAAYRRSLSFDPHNAGSHRELGIILITLGKRGEGLKHLQKAIDLWPDDPYSKVELKDALAQKIDNVSPVNSLESATYKAMDLIASGKGAHAIMQLRGIRGVEARQIRASAYASIGDDEGFITQWQTIAKMKEPVTFHFSDWFFINETIWNKSPIWDIWRSMRGRFVPSMFPLPECFRHHLRHPKWRSPRASEKSFVKLVNSLYHTFFTAHAAKVKGDVSTLRKIAFSHPDWNDPLVFIKQIEKCTISL